MTSRRPSCRPSEKDRISHRGKALTAIAPAVVGRADALAERADHPVGDGDAALTVGMDAVHDPIVGQRTGRRDELDAVR